MDSIKSSRQTSSLMKSILIERFNDIDLLEQLCNQLLDISTANQDTYGIAFANLYLFDAFFTRDDHEKARFYLLRTQSLCDRYQYNDLLMVMHNLAGLYYQDLFDEHSALQHYLLGLDLAQRLNNPITESKIYNNLGICLRRRYDNAAALHYFNAAYETIKPHFCEQERSTTISFLCNAAEVYQAMNMVEESESALKKAQELYTDNQYSYYQLKSTWNGHYAISGDKEKSISIAQELIDDGLSNFSHTQFVSSAYFEVFDHMLFLDCKEMTYRYLTLLESYSSHKKIGDYYNYIVRKTRYYQRYGTSEECDKVYREFYKTSLKLNEVDDAMRVENILSKINLTQALFDLKTIRNENKQLENASHIDELTHLYNRRYLLKLKSKVLIGQDNFQLGYVMLDVDYFKEYNDFYGHFKGDEALRHVADILIKHNKKDIYASRYGGDEFLVLFVNYTKEQIEHYIQCIQKDLKTCNVPHEKSKCASQLTLSIGFSNGYATNETLHNHLLACADKALYQAKDKGRNCYCYQPIER